MSSIPRRFPPPLVPPSRHLVYLLFLNTFVKQFVIARCRLKVYVRPKCGRGKPGSECIGNGEIKRRKEGEQKREEEEEEEEQEKERLSRRYTY